MLRLSFVRVDGQPIAFQLGLEDDPAYYFVKGGFDRDYVRFAPAKLLVEAQLERVFVRGLERFEFLGRPPSRFGERRPRLPHRVPSRTDARSHATLAPAVRRLQQLRAKT